MASVHDVAAAIIEASGPMSAMKLQKLVYYCQAWHLVWDGNPLFGNPIEAWADGPVVRELYDEHRGRYMLNGWNGNPNRLDDSARDTVKAVVESYGRMSARQLSHLTHQEAPWLEARSGLVPGQRGGREIGLGSMAEYYSAVENSPDAEPI